jgi:hypothetical protein
MKRCQGASFAYTHSTAPQLRQACDEHFWVLTSKSQLDLVAKHTLNYEA